MLPVNSSVQDQLLGVALDTVMGRGCLASRSANHSHSPSRQTSQNVVMFIRAIRSDTAELGTALDHVVWYLGFQAASPDSVEQVLFATALLVIQQCIFGHGAATVAARLSADPSSDQSEAREYSH